MTILFRKVCIKDKNSTHNDKIRDLLISNGVIVDISEKIDAQADKTVDLNELHVSPGWIDIFVTGTDPGFEFKDDLDSIAASAAHGGYTHVFLTPNTNPITQNKAGVQYINDKKTSHPVQLHPIGAVTKNTEGKELTEMYDMKNSGAIAFSDGSKSIQSAGLLIKALQYIKAFNGNIIQVPDDRTIAPHGLMHEGIVSTQIGLPGKPALAEEIMVARDIELLRYTDSSLHITGVTLATSVEMIREAKKEGLKLTCSTTTHHLVFTDKDLLDSYNTNLKVNPPLRTESDRLALIQAIKDGTIDCVTTHHTPQHIDAKVCEFEYAGYGMLGLETAFGILGNLGLSLDQILNVLCNHPRKIFGLASGIEKGSSADLTFFAPSGEKVAVKEDVQSRSSNSPYIGMKLKGLVVGTLLSFKHNIK
jgi:dihydroorotase